MAGLNRNAEQSFGIPDGDLRAFRIFCETVYKSSKVPLTKVLDHDWSAWPRLDSALQAIPRPVTREAMGEAAQHLLRQAVEDLRPNFPPREGHVTALEVFELHVLEGQPWPSILAMLEEQGRPHARGTLIRRQHELLPYLLFWTRGETDGARVPVTPAPPVESAPPPKRRWTRVALGIASLVIVVAMLALVPWPQWFANEGSTVDAPTYLLAADLRGRRIPGSLESGGTLEPPWPALELPAVEGHRLVAMALEEEPGDPEILIASQNRADPAPRICRWNPRTRETVWSSTFHPPAQERLTHGGVGPEVLDQSSWVANMFHAGHEGDLGKVVALIVIQKYSPTFVVFMDIDTGQVNGYYVHPGHINSGLVYDVDDDGHCELVLGGQDNSVNRPVLVALSPFTGRRAASTVAWNESRSEGALCRLLLPAWPEAERAIGSRRLSVVEISQDDFVPATRVLSLAIGSGGQLLYHARMGPGLVPDVSAPFVLWDSDEITMQKFDLAPPDFDAWLLQVERIMGGDGI